MEKLVVDGIEIEFAKKKIKNINMTVLSPNGSVRVSAPLKMKEDVIYNFIHSKIDWIRKQQAKFKNKKIPMEKQYITGEIHYFKGKEYVLNVIEAKKKGTVQIQDDRFIDLIVKENSSLEQRQKVLEEWYKEELEKQAEELLIRWSNIIGVKYNSFGIRKMKTRWGSCNINKKFIMLNLDLIKKKEHCLEYVVVHELVHLLEKSHNDRFKNFMTKYLPNWREIKKVLNERVE